MSFPVDSVRSVRTLVCGVAGAASLFAPLSSGQLPEPPAARVFATEIRCSELKATEPQACAAALLHLVRREVTRRFIDHNALHSTESELRRLLEYDEAFARHDRAQRARKRAELDERLSDPQLSPSERTRLQSFRDILLRLEAYEQDLDAGLETRDSIPHETLRRWIEESKFNAALYARYGGTLGVAAYGLYPHGALVTLIGEHRARGEIDVLDATIASYFDAALKLPPAIVHRHGGEPDFTPYWERPIPPSYLPHPN